MPIVDELCFAPASRLVSLLRAREVSSTELVAAFFERIETLNHKVNAVVTLVEERALEEAEEADRRLAQSRDTRPIEGLPISIKDHIVTAGVRSTNGMKTLEHHVPTRDAPAVERLRAAGAIVIAKTNLPEMAMDYDCDNPVFGATRNPWNLDRVPGGSSGGEAAALACGFSALGLGSDIGGSIRVPSHFCGVVGLKPGWGTVPPNGAMVGPIPEFTPMAPPWIEMAVLGPMARFVDDLTLAYNLVRGPHPSSPHTAPSTQARPEQVDLKRLRCAFFTSGGPMPVAPEIRTAVESAARAVNKIGAPVDQKTPPIADAAALWIRYLTPDGNKPLLAMLGDNLELSRERLRLLFPPMPDIGASGFFAAAVERDAFRAELAIFMERHPVIICPVFCTTAFAQGGLAVEVEGQTYPVHSAGWPSTWVNLAGLPAAVVPAGRDREGLPIGVQIVGRAFEEETVLAVARALESELGGYQRPPIQA
jgi:amidase